MILFWILYLIFLFAAVVIVYQLSLRWFYRSFIDNKRRRQR